MAYLIGYIGLVTDTPGFQLPVFNDYAGANPVSIQQLMDDGRVLNFVQYEPRPGESITHLPTRAHEVRDAALWIFKTIDGEVIVALRDEMKDTVRKFISSGAYNSFPFLVCEMAMFSDSLLEVGSTIRQAYQTLREFSETSAVIWRDQSVLLPFIRNVLSPTGDADRVVRDSLISIEIEANENHLLVSCPEHISRATPERTKEIAALGLVFGFDLLAIEYGHELTIPAADLELGQFGLMRETATKVVGLGGLGCLAAHDISRKRAATRRNVRSSPRVVSANGPPRFPKRSGDGQATAFAFGSDRALIATAAELSDNDEPPNAHRSAIVIRPIGFGQRSAAKLSLSQIWNFRGHFDELWVVNTHRLRRPTTSAPNLAASRIAAKSVAACVHCTAMIADGTLQPAIRSRGAAANFNAASFVRWDPFEEPVSSARRALASLLSDELSLVSAEQLLIIAPNSFGNYLDSLELRIGRDLVRISFIVDEDLNRDAIALAVGMLPVRRDFSDFVNLVIELLNLSGWSNINWIHESITAERRGHTYCFEIASRKREIASFINEPTPERMTRRVVVIDISVEGWMNSGTSTVLHFSDIGNWTDWLFAQTEMAVSP